MEINNSKIRTVYVVCVDNEGYAASLERRKIYRRLADRKAAEVGMLRVVDESGEDYLYPENRFVAIDLSPQVIEKLALAV